MRLHRTDMQLYTRASEGGSSWDSFVCQLRDCQMCMQLVGGLQRRRYAARSVSRQLSESSTARRRTEVPPRVLGGCWRRALRVGPSRRRCGGGALARAHPRRRRHLRHPPRQTRAAPARAPPIRFAAPLLALPPAPSLPSLPLPFHTATSYVGPHMLSYFIKSGSRI